ncbi:MAG: class I SAM-dependent methyltransferase [Sedimentisphaerales bacterium]|nr:class I SAM-dependent methyltransferase [Sedimentisphaerales bacterium]
MSERRMTVNTKKLDWENPSLLWRIEDFFKGLFGERFLYNTYVDVFQLKGLERALDFGCGGGVCSRLIAKKLSGTGHLTCVDVSAYQISKARKKLKRFVNVDFIVGDVTESDALHSSYDIISIFHVLHDIEPAKRQTTINYLSGKLTENGRLYVCEPTRQSHGMKPEAVRLLMSGAGLAEKRNKTKKSSYVGEFQKVTKQVPY